MVSYTVTRTTITLDEDVALLVQREIAATGSKFKDVVNQALRKQLSADTYVDLHFPSHDCGELLVDVTNFNQLASALEDEYLLQKMSRESADAGS